MGKFIAATLALLLILSGQWPYALLVLAVYLVLHAAVPRDAEPLTEAEIDLLDQLPLYNDGYSQRNTENDVRRHHFNSNP